MEKPNENACQCQNASCGCAGAPVEPCNCGERCACSAGCRCEGGCDCEKAIASETLPEREACPMGGRASLLCRFMALCQEHPGIPDQLSV